MDASTLRLGFLIGVIGLISVLLWRDRENVERKGILFFRRTQRGIDLIDRIAKKTPKFWNVYAWTGVVAAFASMILITVVLGRGILDTVLSGVPSESFGLVAPGTGSSVSTQPGVTFVPAEYWFISIAVIMVVHELSHGIIARLEDFEINSVGVLVLGIIPGAFVEPKGENMLPNGDDEQEENENEDGEEGMAAPWDQGDWKSRLKVLSAGSFANYVTAFIFLAAFFGASNLMASPGEVNYQAQASFPAAEAGMNQGRLLAFNGSEIDNITEFTRSADSIKANETYNLVTSEGEFNVTATSREGVEGDSGYIGVRFSPFTPLENWFASLLQIIAVLNLGIGMFNMLPAKPLDGGHIIDTVVERFIGDEGRRYVNIWSLAVILILAGVLVYSIFGPF